MSLFVTATDTGVGKTHTAVQLLRLLGASGMRGAGMKPICCGDRRDAELLLAAGRDGLTINEVNPVWWETPVAPFAAQLEANAGFRVTSSCVLVVNMCVNKLDTETCGFPLVPS